MFAIIFTIILLLITALSIKRNFFFPLFFSFILFLPDFYGLDIHNSLPILSFSRVSFFIMYCYVLYNYRNDIVPFIKSIKITPLFVAFFIYFSFRIVANIYYITTYRQSLKTIIFLILEDLGLLAVAFIIKFKKSDIIPILKFIVYGSGIMYVLGIIESFSLFKFGNYLFTVHRPLLNDYYLRLGLLRSVVTMGLPGVFGNMCVLVAPAILFLYHYASKKRYIFLAALNLFACIHSGTRSSLFFLIFVYACGFIIVIKDKRQRITYLKNVLIVAAASLSIITILCFSSDKLRYYYVTSGKAILNCVGFDFDLNAGAPKGVDGYGANLYGNVSRIDQFTGIYYAANKNLLFGLGSGAQTRREAYYFTLNKWYATSTYDVGYVQAFMDEGLIGFIGYISLFVALFIIAFSLKKRKTFSYPYVFLSIITYLVCMFGTANMPYYLWTIVFLAVAVYRNSEETVG